MDIGKVQKAVQSVTDFDSRKAGWDSWMQKPENRAFMLQTGIALMQGPAPGQSMMGSFGTAIGQGAAARDRNIQSGIDQQAAAQDRKYKTENQQMNKEELALKKQELQQKTVNDKALNDYRTNMGLSAVLRAKQPRGRTPKTVDEAWLSAKSKIISEGMTLNPNFSAQDVEKARQLFYEDYAKNPDSISSLPADTGASEEEWGLDENGVPIRIK